LSVDKYGVYQDPDCYPDTDVLKNLLNLRNAEDLTEAERYLTQVAASQLEFEEPPYDLGTLKRIHRCLFSSIYSWAGETRSVKISKGHSHFCVPDRIEPEVAKEFSRMARAGWFEGYSRDSLVVSVAQSYGTLNVAHPFREGNGRAQRVLFEWLVVNAGFEITWGRVGQEQWVAANIESFQGNDQALELVFNQCIGAPIREVNDPS